MEQEHHNPSSEPPPNRAPLRERLFQGSEGRILISGVILGLAYTLAVALSWFRWPGAANGLLAMTATNILFGRVAGLSFGFAAGLDEILVTTLNMLIETVLVLLFYPLFVLSCRHLVEIKALGQLMARTRAAAEANRDVVRRFGVLGLFIFVWIPFWMTGPMIGSVLGFFMGLRSWVNLTVVLAGTYTATACWAWGIHQIHDLMSRFSPYYGPLILVVLLILIALAARALQRTRREEDSEPAVSPKR